MSALRPIAYFVPGFALVRFKRTLNEFACFWVARRPFSEAAF
jgi:hypothetical protein